MYYTESSIPVSTRELAAIVDATIDDRLTRYYEILREHDLVDVDESGNPDAPANEEVEKALMEVVFMSDVRANLDAENNDEAIISPLAWLGVARQAIARLTEPAGIESLAEVHIFGDDDTVQEAAYFDMKAQYEKTMGLKNHVYPGLDYAVKVVTGEARLYPAN